MSRRLQLLAEAGRLVLAFPALPLLVLAALAVRPATDRRRRRGLGPRLVFGPTPIISIKYMREAAARLGFEARTVVYDVYPINERSDFDEVLTERYHFLGPLARVVQSLGGAYLVFGSSLFRFDVFHFFFDGGFLAPTPLRFLETQLLHLAGKKVVVMPYGSDVAVPSRLRSAALRHGFAVNYPELGRREPQTTRRIHYFSARADMIVACLMHFETLPRWDLLTIHYYPIDTDAWRPVEQPVGDRSTLVVAHAPNHRSLKGTEFLIAACEQLQADGYKLELRLLERLPNREIRRVLSECDVVAEQFIVGYALTAMEAMALGKPVLSNLSAEGYYEPFRLYAGLDECPILDTPVERIKENLKLLLEDPDLRDELGRAGRRYVERFHSYAVVGQMWQHVYDHVWHGRPLEISAWNPSLVSVDQPAREFGVARGR
jgi:glycosyltransferase involved in cell wall biosynthesis